MASRFAIAAVLALVLLPARAATSAMRPLSYRHSLERVNAQLRVAIESGPEELGEDLHASETICGLAERAAGQGDASGAEADWSTLAQFVDSVDAPDGAAIDGAFRRADSALGGLRVTFARAWRRQSARVARLHRGVAETRGGIAAMRAAMGQLETAFPAWRSRRCHDAVGAIEAATRALVPGLAEVNAGMALLVRLAE